MNLFKFIFFASILLIIVALGIKECTTYSSAKAAGEEIGYFRRRLKRRLVGLGLLTVILILIALHGKFLAVVESPGLNLIYLLGCLALTLVIFALVIIDLKETSDMVLKSQRDLARDSISSLQRRVRDFQKADAEPEASRDSITGGARQADVDTQDKD